MKASTFIGYVIKKNDAWNAVRVRVQKMEMDRYLSMYFNKRYHYWAADPEGECIEGDVVLIKLLPEPQSARVKHYVKETVFKVGQTVDPVTGLRCRGPDFIDEGMRQMGPIKLTVGDVSQYGPGSEAQKQKGS